MSDPILLDRCRRLSFEQLTETENSIQRCAQLVAHARKEFAFCLAGPLYFFHALAFGNVLDSSFVVGNLAFAVPHDARVLAEPQLALVLPKDFVLEQLDRSLRLD